MSTTTMSYTIKHGGTTLGTFSRATQVDIKHGSNSLAALTSTATKTLATGGKFCPSNIVIGDKTLATAGKYIPSNIVVNTTATTYYYWNKYYISTGQTTLAVASGAKSVWLCNMATQGLYGLTQNIGTKNVDFVAGSGFRFHNQGTYITFNLVNSYTQKVSNYSTTYSALAKYYMIGPSIGTGLTYSPHYLYVAAKPYTGSTSSKRYVNITEASSWDISVKGNDTSTYASLVGMTNTRGSYIGQVSSTSTSTYPSNGISGGYWYTYVG